MISPNQSAFIKGRFIQDNFMPADPFRPLGSPCSFAFPPEIQRPNPIALAQAFDGQPLPDAGCPAGRHQG